jgi:hypothetical protein
MLQRGCCKSFLTTPSFLISQAVCKAAALQNGKYRQRGLCVHQRCALTPHFLFRLRRKEEEK